jgi:hypothetical protein
VQEPPVFSTPTAVRVTAATPFAANCLAVPVGATAYVNAEVEPHLAIDATNPNHLVAGWQQDRMSDGGARGLMTAVSVDGGTTWSGPQSSPFSRCAGGTFERVSDPWVASHGTTTLQIGIAFSGGTFTTGARSAVLVSRSGDGGATWGAAIPLVDDDGLRMFHDKESLTIDSTDPRYVYATWDRLDTSDTGVTLLARSTDGGVTWEPPVTIYDPGLARQTIGNVAVTTPDGAVHVFFTELAPSPTNPAAADGRLAVIRSTDKGVTWSTPTYIAQLLSVGTRVLSSQPTVAVRAGEVLGAFAANPVDGSLYAVWQDGRFTGGAHDAIVLSRSTDGGTTWSAPVRVSTDATVPAFTPTLAVLPSGLVGVLYYDFRQAGTATFRPTDVWLAVSRDGTAWRETRLAGTFDLLDAPNANGLFVGDYHGLAGAGATFVALYARTNTGDNANRTDVFADRVNGDAIAKSGALAGTALQKAAPPPWTPFAADEVALHLGRVLEKRNARLHPERKGQPAQKPK